MEENKLQHFEFDISKQVLILDGITYSSTEALDFLKGKVNMMAYIPFYLNGLMERLK